MSSASLLIQNSGKIVTLCKLNVNVYRNYEFLPRKTRTLEPRRLLIRSKLWIIRFNCSKQLTELTKLNTAEKNIIFREYSSFHTNLCKLTLFTETVNTPILPHGNYFCCNSLLSPLNQVKIVIRNS